MKKTILALLACLTVSASATTVSLSNTIGGPAVFNSTNTAKVVNGSLVRIGSISNLADAAASFVEFGTNTIKSIGIGANARPGKLVGSVTSTAPESGNAHTAFNGQTVYVWIYNAAAAAGSTEQGIFATTRVFPNHDPAGVGDDLTIDVANEILTTVPLAGFTPALIVPGDATDSKHFVLGAVPEPATTSILGLSMIGLLLRRRRK